MCGFHPHLYAHIGSYWLFFGLNALAPFGLSVLPSTCYPSNGSLPWRPACQLLHVINLKACHAVCLCLCQILIVLPALTPTKNGFQSQVQRHCVFPYASIVLSQNHDICSVVFKSCAKTTLFARFLARNEQRNSGKSCKYDSFQHQLKTLHLLMICLHLLSKSSLSASNCVVVV